ncbi:unnamed protein product, partial [Adineta ricciae]
MAKRRRPTTKKNNKSLTHLTAVTHEFILYRPQQWKAYYWSISQKLRRLSFVINVHLRDDSRLYVTTRSRDDLTRVQHFLHENVITFMKKYLQSKKKIGHKKSYQCCIKSVKISKPIWKYIQQERKYRRRHPAWTPLVLRGKRSRVEYEQRKNYEQQKTKTRKENTHKARWKIEPNRYERKLRGRYKCMTTYSYNAYTKLNKILSIEGRTNTTKKQIRSPFVSLDFHKKVDLLLPRSATTKKIVYRYYNQHIFVYSMPIHCSGRPSRKYLIKTVSTVDDSQQTHLELPKYGPKELLIKVTHVAQNPTDWKHVHFDLAKSGSIVGCDFAGEVVEVGSEAVGNYKKGERVAGCVHGGQDAKLNVRGAYSEYVVQEASLVFRYPSDMSPEAASTIPLASITAALCLFHEMNLPFPPATAQVPVLIWAGSTSVGQYAIQLAKAAGCYVITTASAARHDYLKELGADVCFDYKDKNA